MPEALTVQQKAQRLAGAVRHWIKQGLPIADQETRDRRMEVCSACEHWDPDGNLQLGECRECGCTALKVCLGTSKCPIGKW